MANVPQTPQSLVATLLFEQLLRPLEEHAGAAGGYAVDRFAEILASRLEKKDE